MRAREPDTAAWVVRDGVRVAYEVFGHGDPTVLLVPSWPVFHSKLWKAQVPYLARFYRVIAVDGRGNGGSDRPIGATAYADDEFLGDLAEVMDATRTAHAVVAGVSFGGLLAFELAALHPERVRGVVGIGASVPHLTPPSAGRDAYDFDAVYDRHEGWGKYNRHYWRTNYREFLEFFAGQVYPEPHSTKQIEDAIGWGLETTPDVLVATESRWEGDRLATKEAVEELLANVRCPALLIHGTDDHVVPWSRSEAVAARVGGRLELIVGGGHCPHARDPVRVNLLIREFVESILGPGRTAGPRCADQPAAQASASTSPAVPRS
jgi:pimeloyl-ACP methyl ester carboxylesterase